MWLKLRHPAYRERSISSVFIMSVVSVDHTDSPGKKEGWTRIAQHFHNLENSNALLQMLIMMIIFIL